MWKILGICVPVFVVHVRFWDWDNIWCQSWRGRGLISSNFTANTLDYISIWLWRIHNWLLYIWMKLQWNRLCISNKTTLEIIKIMLYIRLNRSLSLFVLLSVQLLVQLVLQFLKLLWKTFGLFLGIDDLLNDCFVIIDVVYFLRRRIWLPVDHVRFCLIFIWRWIKFMLQTLFDYDLQISLELLLIIILFFL